MADNDSSLSAAPTLKPGDSASQVAAPTTTDQGKNKAHGKRTVKNVLAKDVPPGAIQVEKGGKDKSKKVSQVTSATIPLTGWADLDLVATRKEVIPTFTIDANPFLDLVDAEFDRIVARCPSSGKFIPFALFRYYSMILFWYRVLFLQKSNGQLLTTDEKNFLNAFQGTDDFTVPLHIAQYLGNMGNFIQGGETYFFRVINFRFTGVFDGLSVEKGWLDCGNALTTITTGQQFWAYAQLPVPAVFATSICNEIAHNDPSNPGLTTLDHVVPTAEDGYEWLPTQNILGWMNQHHLYNHSSHRSTYYNLGWRHDDVPTDTQTPFLFSASSMRWMSDRLALTKELKTYPSNQLTLSVMGSPMQAYWLEVPDKFYSRDNLEYRFADNRVKATLFSELALVSRFGVDVKATTPAYSFGYRLARDFTISGFDGRTPIYTGRSNFQPWIYLTVNDEDEEPGVISDPPAQFIAGTNATLIFGSAANLNVPRFETPTYTRDVALQRTLVLTD